MAISTVTLRSVRADPGLDDFPHGRNVTLHQEMPRRRNPLFPESHLHVLDVNSAAAVILEGPHGLAAYGVGPLQHAGLSLSAIFGGTAIVAAVLAVLSSAVSPFRHRPAGHTVAGSSASRRRK